MGRAGQRSNAQRRTSAYFCSVLESVTGVLGIMHPRLAALLVVHPDENFVPVLLLQSPDHLLSPAFSSRSVFYT